MSKCLEKNDIITGIIKGTIIVIIVSLFVGGIKFWTLFIWGDLNEYYTYKKCYKCTTQTISKDGKITIERMQEECGDYLKISNYVAKNTYTIDSVQIKTTCK